MAEPTTPPLVFKLSTRRIVGRLWLVKLSSRGSGAWPSYMPYWSKGNPRQELMARHARVLARVLLDETPPIGTDDETGTDPHA
jgi:hypothetical protein